MQEQIGPNLNAWVVTLVLPVTVATAVALGVVASYGAISGILHALSASQPQPEAKPVLLAQKAQAGAD
jgi:hypothetical protein